MKTPTTKRRLKRLIAYMRKLPASANKHFDMAWWFKHEGDHKHKIGKYIDRRALTECGTTACALGWAATIPSLRKAGLRVIAEAQSDQPLDQASRIFGLNEEQLIALFVPSMFWDRPMNGVNTPKQWAQKAEQLVRKWESE